MKEDVGTLRTLEVKLVTDDVLKITRVIVENVSAERKTKVVKNAELIMKKLVTKLDARDKEKRDGAH